MNVTFAKINCGRNHSLLLSRNGDIYAFGKNSFGQLGNDGYLTPNIEIEEKFIDIATHPQKDISVTLSNKEKVFWGESGEEVIKSPFETKFESFGEFFCRKYSNEL
jgi:alpha-tubulin suppressor-like RCC1 family protein